MQFNRRTFLALGATCAALPVMASAAPVVFAAASLKPALDRIAEGITPMRLSYGGSGALARQITQGAPAGIFLSANPAWMDAVAPRIIAGTRHDLLGNALVLVGHAAAPPVKTRGELPYAVVYASDAQAEPSLKVLHRFAPETHSPIRYPLALLDEAARPAYQALRSPQAAAIFAQTGLEVL